VICAALGKEERLESMLKARPLTSSADGLLLPPAARTCWWKRILRPGAPAALRQQIETMRLPPRWWARRSLLDLVRHPGRAPRPKARARPPGRRLIHLKLILALFDIGLPVVRRYVPGLRCHPFNLLHRSAQIISDRTCFTRVLSCLCRGLSH